VRARISPCRDWSCSRIVSTRIHFLIVGRGIARIVTLQRGARAPKLLHRPQREVRRGTYEFCASGIEGSLSLSLSISLYLSIYLSVCLRKLIAGSNGTESVHRSALATWRRQLSRNVSEMRLRRRRHRVEFISGFVRGLISRSEKSWQNRALLGPRFFSEIDD